MNPNFSGLQLYRDQNGVLRCNLFQNGSIIPLEPNEKDKDRELGFYDEDMNPVEDPAKSEEKDE